MADSGLIVITAFISPFRAERDMVRSMLPEGEFVEIFIDTALAEVIPAGAADPIAARAEMGGVVDGMLARL